MRQQQVLVGLGLGDPGAGLGQLRFGLAPLPPRGLDALDVAGPVAVEQRAVAARVDQPAVVVLAVQLDQRRGDRPQQRGADRLVVDEGLAPAVGAQRAAQDQRLARLDLDLGLGQRFAHRFGQRGELERRGNARPLLARADQRGFRPVAEHQPERVEQDRLARPGLAGQHPEPAGEGEVQRLDQHDVPDSQTGQHPGQALGSRPITGNRQPC